MKCPRCRSEQTVKNGSIHNGKAKRMCKDCRRQFVPDATKKVISPQTGELIDKLLLEKIPLAGIVRVSGISADHLQTYVNRQDAAVPRAILQHTPQKGDELSSATKCGPSSAANATGSGFGWPSMSRVRQLSGALWGHVTGAAPRGYGPRCPRSIANVRWPTQMSGPPTGRSFQPAGTARSVRRPGARARSSASTIPCASASRASSARPCRSPKS